MSDAGLQNAVNELLTLYGGGRIADMERRARALRKSWPGSPILCELLGMAVAAQGRFQEALALFERAVRGEKGDPQFWENLGQCQRQLGHFEDAEKSLRQALALRPRWIDTLDALASVLRSLGRHHEARSVIDDVLSIDPNYTHRLLQEKEHYLRSAIAADPARSEFHDELGLLLRTKGDLPGAEASMRRAIACDPNNPRAYLNLASLMSSLRHDQEALALARTGLGLLGPVDAGSSQDERDLYAVGAFILYMAGQGGEAVAMYKVLRAFNKDPSLAIAMVHAAREACDWEFAAALEADACTAARHGLDSRVASPWQLLALAGASPLDQLAAAQSYARQVTENIPSRLPAAPAARARRSGRLRISYFARDFYDHAIAVLIAGVIEAHDRGQFEIVAHDYSPFSDGQYRRRLQSAFDRTTAVGELPDEAAAQRIAADDVDLIVDISGWTSGHRGAVLAFRPAPVQVQWLGYPGTMGASWIDYIIADRVLIPPGHETHFSEKVIRLPDTYQPSDDKRPIGEPRTRSDHGLPDDAFVFCSFNQVFKVTPEVFSVWMELLKAVDHSVLWSLTPAQAASEALLREAANRGVDPARIVFAPRLPIPEHAARLAHADLALDCFPYGSHTTASDVLRAGVPLVALAGETFASRVSASILTAAGLPELITTSLDDYRELAMRIATDRERLALLKSRVRNECRASALFDTQRFARNLEKAYLAAWNRYDSGQRPDHIDVD